MDLSPFDGINPCGYPGLAVTQLADLGVDWGVEDAGMRLVTPLATHLGYASEAVSLRSDPFQPSAASLSRAP